MRRLIVTHVTRWQKRYFQLEPKLLRKERQSPFDNFIVYEARFFLRGDLI